MSISRIQAIEAGNSVPKVDIDSTKNNIPKVPVDLIGGSSPIDLQSITITENGTAEAPEGIAYNEVVVNVDTPTLTSISITENGTTEAPEGIAYNEVIVNVPPSMPNEYLESEFDTENSNSTTGFLDSVKNIKLPTLRYSNFNNGYLTSNGGYLTMSLANSGDVKKVIYEMGAFDRSLEPQQQYLGLFCFAYDTQGLVLYYDNNDDRWLVRDSGGVTQYISGSVLPKYALENATIEVIYGAKYINGELYRGMISGGAIVDNYSQRVTMYIHAQNEQEYVIEYSAELSADRPDYMFTTRIGSGGSAWLGALFKNVKIYNVLNVYNRFYESNTNTRKMKNGIEPLKIISIENKER